MILDTISAPDYENDLYDLCGHGPDTFSVWIFPVAAGKFVAASPAAVSLTFERIQTPALEHHH
uniref:Uncharacterized protein n=1 Tax=Pseudoalteromonas rubra TaxID=43658 RepID=A0A0F4QH90_9GAMM|nr:hypothetical protein TW77_16410 [Pseudoalteromonas rubra]